MLRGNLFWQRFAGGLKGPAVDKQSVNSLWSGPPRGQWSPSLKPLVWHCVSSLSPCWLHKAKVLCDCLQAPLFCFVCLFFPPFLSCSGFFLGGGDLRGIWWYPDFSLAQCIEVWLTSRFVCFFPGTFPSLARSNSCLRSALALCWARWLRLEDELLRRHLFDRSSQLRLYTCWRNHTEEPCDLVLIIQLCFLLLLKQDGFSTSVLDPQNSGVLKLPINDGAKSLWRYI